MTLLHGDCPEAMAATCPCIECPSTCCGELGDYGLSPSSAAQADCAAYQDWAMAERGTPWP